MESERQLFIESLQFTIILSWPSVISCILFHIGYIGLTNKGSLCSIVVLPTAVSSYRFIYLSLRFTSMSTKACYFDAMDSQSLNARKIAFATAVYICGRSEFFPVSLIIRVVYTHTHTHTQTHTHTHIYIYIYIIHHTQTIPCKGKINPPIYHQAQS